LGARHLFCTKPGKKDIRWNRDLQLDLNAIKDNNIQVIVCLLEWSEMKKLVIMIGYRGI
jgi:hypothetical protein